MKITKVSALFGSYKFMVALRRKNLGLLSKEEQSRRKQNATRRARNAKTENSKLGFQTSHFVTFIQ